MTYNEFVTEWNNKQVTKYGGECVALVAEFESENGLPIVWGDAYQWANNPIMLSTYDWVLNLGNNQNPPQGAIVVWGSTLPYSGGKGHIAFFDHNIGGNQMASFGQNSGGPQAHMQAHSWDYVLGWYIPKITAPTHPFTVTPLTAPEQLVTIQNCCSYNLDYPTDVENHPYTGYAIGTRLEAVASAYHQNGKKYFLTDAAGIQGFYEADVTYYVEPVVVAPKPYIPPAAPVQYTPAEKYILVATVPGFKTADDAANDVNAVRVIKAGTYTVYGDKTRNQVPLLVDTNVSPKVVLWVNPIQNVKEEIKNVSLPVAIEVTPEPPVVPVSAAVPTDVGNAWKTTQATFYLNRDPEVFSSRNLSNINIYDLEGKHEPIQLEAQKKDVRIVATFEKDGVLYGRPEACFKPKSQFFGSWYGVPMSILDYNSVTTTAERLALGTGRFKDKVLYEVSKGIKLIEDIKLRRKK